jgi:hypothetical protein
LLVLLTSLLWLPRPGTLSTWSSATALGHSRRRLPFASSGGKQIGWVLSNRGLSFLTSGRVGKYWVAFPYGLLNCAAMDLLQLTPARLRQAASLKERIDELEGELESILGTSATATPSRKLHWTQTPAGRARLARSVRRSWRTRHRSLRPTAPSPARTGKKLHWTQTPEGRARLARSIRRSWRTRRRS